MDLDKVLYGGDYNPEQWLDRPDILEEDIAMMQEAHINTVTLGVFSWSTLEPEEGKYNFGWLDTIMDRLDQAGISVILATPSGARPQWMAEKYPEVLRVNERRERAHYLPDLSSESACHQYGTGKALWQKKAGHSLAYFQ